MNLFSKLIILITFILVAFVLIKTPHPVITKNIENNLSPDTIFQYSDPEKESVRKDNPNEYIIIATGDLVPARTVNYKLTQMNNFTYPYENTLNFLKSGDVLFVNLEAPLIPSCKLTVEGMTFCGDERNIQGLVFGGVKVANLANNHMGNYGLKGIENTVNLLKNNDIQVIGNNEPAVVKIKNKKFGFLGYNYVGAPEPGISWADISQIEKDIKDLKEKVDFIIVTFHWGIEYQNVPSVSQIQLAHQTIDAGADLIIGNHPHWVQGIEKYHGKFITYAHGNFIFDQMWSQETKEGVLAKYIFNKDGLAGVKFYPIIIENYVQARFAGQDEANNILNRMKESSEEISTISLKK